MNRLWALAIVAAAVALACAARAIAEAPEAAAKKYRELPTVEDFSPKDWTKIKLGILSAGRIEGEAEKKLSADYYRWAVGELTRWKNRENLAVIRGSIEKDLYTCGNAPESSLHDQLVATLSAALPRIFGSADYSPAARVNCLLLYGKLNSKEPDPAGRGAESLAAARPVLVGIVNDAKQPAYLRAAALAGITRHAENSAAADVRRDLAPSMIKLLSSEPTKDTSKEVHNYFRRRAAEILRVIANKGYDAGMTQAVDPLARLAADEDARLEERCEAIRALGYLDKRNYAERRVGEIARTFTAFAAEVARQTPAPTVAEADGAPADGAPAAADPLAETKPAAPTPAPAAPAEAAKPPEEKPEAKSQPVLSPDNQVYFLKCVDMGLNGPGGDAGKGRGLATATSDDASKKLVAGLSAKLVEMGKIIVRRKDKTGPLNDDEIAKLQMAAEELETLLDTGAVGDLPSAPPSRRAQPVSQPVRAP